MKRRDFLKTVCITSAACILPACKTISDIKHTSAVLKNNQLIVPKSRFSDIKAITIGHGDKAIGLVKLNNDNFAASLLTCTHRGCEVAISDNGYVCPCHGARFNQLGEVTKGPANENLITYITSTDKQFVYIHLP